jgi:transcriptional regulator with XRE-family HTH domain
MSKSALAKSVGVSTTCVWNWEEGNTEPRPENLVALADALSVSAEHLERGAVRHSEVPLKTHATVGETSLSLSEEIEKFKAHIAARAGTTVEKVIVSISY